MTREPIQTTETEAKAQPIGLARRAALEKARREGMARATPGPDAARSQDFLYGPDGKPG